MTTPASQSPGANPSTSEGKPLLVLISAPSGAGKTTVCQQVLAARPNMVRVITCTTRAARAGEQAGIDYFFLEAAEFETRVLAGHFLEHATVYGNRYGTLKSEVMDKLRAGRDVLLNVDVQGAAAIRAEAAGDPELRAALVTVFMTPASINILEERLRRRGTDDEATVRRRLSVAREEIAHWREFDYLLISSTISEDLRRMLQIVEVEKIRSTRAPAPET